MDEQQNPVRSPNSKQVIPEFKFRPGHKDIEAKVRAFLESRLDRGEKTYGTRLYTHNGRNALKDAKEELADAVLYLMQAKMEAEDAGDKPRHMFLSCQGCLILGTLADLIMEEERND